MSALDIRSVADVERDSQFAHVAEVNVPVWPGYMTMFVVRDLTTGLLWAANIRMDDDTSSRDEQAHWFRVAQKTVTTTVYERIQL